MSTHFFKMFDAAAGTLILIGLALLAVGLPFAGQSWVNHPELDGVTMLITCACVAVYAGVTSPSLLVVTSQFYIAVAAGLFCFMVFSLSWMPDTFLQNPEGRLFLVGCGLSVIAAGLLVVTHSGQFLRRRLSLLSDPGA